MEDFSFFFFSYKVPFYYIKYCLFHLFIISRIGIYIIFKSFGSNGNVDKIFHFNFFLNHFI